MNWLQKTSQPKPFLPFEKPEGIKGRGLRMIDMEMDQETADAEKLRLDPEYLGAGGMGLAGTTPEGTVVKWTKEKDEANILEHFMGKNVPCLPEVYDVRQLQTFLWAITMERVETLPDKNEIRLAIRYLKYMEMDDLPEEHFNGYLEKFKKLVAEFPYIGKIVADYQVMWACLKSNNIIPGDAHSGNVGYNKDGNLVLFDLGLSSLTDG